MPDTVDDNTQVVVAVVEGHHPIGMKVMVEIDLVGESRSKKGKIEMMLRTMTKYITYQLSHNRKRKTDVSK